MKLTEAQTAERIGIAAKTLSNWRSSNAGPPYFKVGGRVLYDASDIDAWLLSKRRVTAEFVSAKDSAGPIPELIRASR